MNSYNENLHATVVDSLDSQNLELKKTNAVLEASMFTLYYAEGARITALEKLEAASDIYDFQYDVLRETVNNSNISNNLLLSANDEKSLVDQSVTNTAVAASNIQVATNSIVRLASDMGSILSIVSAADFNTEIYKMANDAYSLMSTTAYQAELLSQHAMESSRNTAEISADTVATVAKKTNDSITSFLTLATADLDATAETVKADTEELGKTSAAEKLAEGKLEDTNVEYYASQRSYYSSNNELNLNLRTLDKNNLGFTVNFSYYESPFPQVKEVKDPKTGKVSYVKTPIYPVKDYYVMLVKEKRKSTFSITNADSIVTRDPKGTNKQFIHISPDSTKTFASKKIDLGDLIDTEGNPMVLGQKYVVFVLAQFDQAYKKNLNNFEDFLTAPSATFTLTNTLVSPAANSIKVGDVEKDGNRLLSFSVAQSADLIIDYPTFEVDYRCMYLPDNSELVKGVLTEEGLRSLEKEIERMERIANKYDPIIASLEDQKMDVEKNHADTNLAIEEWDDKYKDYDKAPPVEKKKKDQLDKEFKKYSNELTVINTKLKKEMDAKTAELANVVTIENTTPGFFFNLLLAEQVAAGNYTSAVMDKSVDSEIPKYSAKIDETTTDNFGNPLVEGKKYIPVVLSLAGGNEINLDEFTNSLSDFTTTASFTDAKK